MVRRFRAVLVERLEGHRTAQREGMVSVTYWFVDKAVPAYEPAWHWQMYRATSYPFPTEGAADRFAAHQRELWPTATVTVREGQR